MATIVVHKYLFTYYQKDVVDNHTYFREFMTYAKTIETYGGVSAVGITPAFLTVIGHGDPSIAKRHALLK